MKNYAIFNDEEDLQIIKDGFRAKEDAVRVLQKLYGDNENYFVGECDDLNDFMSSLQNTYLTGGKNRAVKEVIIQRELTKWYMDMTIKALNKEIFYTVTDTNNAVGDCVYVDFNIDRALILDGVMYKSNIVVFYGEKIKYAPDKSTGYYNEMYSFTSEGFGNGLYINNRFKGEEKKLFNAIKELINREVK